jgi:hypothetical protein
MSEIKHKRIWLEPAHESDAYGERQWCQQNVWGDNADEYVLASSLFERPSLSPSIASLQAENERLELERAEQWRLRREAEGDRDLEKAVSLSFKQENERLKAENQRLRNATEWYGNAVAIASTATQSGEAAYDDLMMDAGAKARAALGSNGNG